MKRFSIMTIMTMLAMGTEAVPQERGVEFTLLPSVSDTTAGSVLYFEIAAKNESGVMITDWDSTGFPVQIELRNSTANSDTSMKSWSGNKQGYSFAKMYDSHGRELALISGNAFYVPNSLFSGGRLQVAFTHTKAESNVSLQILPKKTSSDKQATLPYTFTPGPVNHFFVDITGQTAPGQAPSPDRVFLRRGFELVVAARDRFQNVVQSEVPVAYTARFPSELPAIQNNALPQFIEGMTAAMLAPEKTRVREIGDTLHTIRVFHPSLIGIEGRCDPFEVLDHPPGPFMLRTPLSGTEIQLGDWKTEVHFEWDASEDPYTSVPVSRFDGITASDTVRYRFYLADYNNLATQTSYLADDDGRAQRMTLTHGALADAAKLLHDETATRLNAVWSVVATDGIYTVTSASATTPTETGHTIQADLRTLAVERIGDAAIDHALLQNYPNPFNPSTTIEYTVPQRTPVRIQVFDVYGSLVTTLVDAQAEPGLYRVVWNGRTGNGRNAPTGSYVLMMTTGTQSQSRVMSLIQ